MQCNDCVKSCKNWVNKLKYENNANWIDMDFFMSSGSPNFFLSIHFNKNEVHNNFQNECKRWIDMLQSVKCQYWGLVETWIKMHDFWFTPSNSWHWFNLDTHLASVYWWGGISP